MRTDMSSLRIPLLSSGLLVALTGFVQAAALTTVEVFPPEINLTTSRARQLLRESLEERK